MGRGCVGFFGFLGERGREALQGEKPSSLACSASRGRRWQTVLSK